MKLKGFRERTGEALEAQGKNEESPAVSRTDLVVNGIRYASAHDAAAAREEIKKIEYIKGRMNFNNPAEVFAIYDKMIDNRLFVTPSGFEFLFEIRRFLLDCPFVDNETIRAIPTDSLFTQRAKNEVRAELRHSNEPDLKKELKTTRSGYRTSVIVNIFLVILVIAMFIIALNSDNPNILNYKNAIENEYAEWGQELSERETAVREKEKELGIAKGE